MWKQKYLPAVALFSDIPSSRRFHIRWRSLTENSGANIRFLYCCSESDKMSNEVLYTALPCTQIRFWWISWHSQTIRKMQLVAGWLVFILLCQIKSPHCILCLFITGFDYSFYYLPICWRCSPSGERNSKVLTSIFQRFDFRARNKRVW